MSQNRPSGLRFDPHIVAAPLYSAGTSVLAARQKTQVEEIIKLASNESPIGPSPKALAAIQAELTELHRYPPAEAGSLYRALADHLGGGLTPEHFVAGSGASEVIDLLSRAFVREGDNVIACRPTFPLYEICAQRCGGDTFFADLDERYEYDVEGILKAINERTRIVYLCTPNNPSGSILPPPQAERLVAEIPPDVLIVFDESYRLFVEHPDDLIDSTGYVLKHPNVVSLGSFSKSYGLAGLRIGYAITAPEVASYVQRLLQPFQLGSLALTGAIAALDDDEYVREAREIVITERGWLIEQMAALGLEVLSSQSNFVTARAATPPRIIYERLMAEGIIIRPLALFYMPDWFRVTAGRHTENERFIEALKKVLHALAEESIVQESDAGSGRVMV
jgi:histidinol-phosphate aminotransferase